MDDMDIYDDLDEFDAKVELDKVRSNDLVKP